VFRGRIAFADSYGALGTVIIVDHGSRYYTLMANLGEIKVRVGDVVDEGQTLAATNSNGGSLFFEIRHGLDRVSPMGWMIDGH
jgi:septal ring factor EnvC (AmiA/AmiB activator)